ncbi:MAG: TetR/AcrR family transcriptional regulator [Novosphingobium sp.]
MAIGQVDRPAAEPKRRAGRPTAARAAAIDWQIRDAARKLFVEIGLDAASMDAVAAAAGVSKGTLYTRFSGKDALLRAVIDDLIGQLKSRASATDDQLPPALGPRLRAYARKLVETFEWSEYAQLNRLVLAASQTYPEVGHQWNEAATAGYVQMLAFEMQRAAQLPASATTDWHFLANLFLYALSGWYRNEQVCGTLTEARFETYCASVVDTIVFAVTGERHRPGRD